MKKYLVPIGLFVVLAGLYCGISIYQDNQALFSPVYDVEHYLTISLRGYDAHPCGPNDMPPGKICGNVGWYPMWPILVNAVRPLVDGSSYFAFIGLAFACTLLAFIFFHDFLKEKYGSSKAIFTLLAVVCAPTGFYFLTGFPYAMMMLLFVIYLILLYSPVSKGRKIWLFVIALMLSLAYPTGLLYGIIPLVWFISERKDSLKSFEGWKKLFFYLLPFILGPLLLAIYFYFKFDDFFLQLHFQEKYGRDWGFPLWVMARSLSGYPLYSPENLVLLWYGLAFILFFPYRTGKELWILALVLYLFTPTTGNLMSVYRHYLVIFPIYMMIGLSDRPVWLKAGFCAAGLVSAIWLYFPIFLRYRLI